MSRWDAHEKKVEFKPGHSWHAFARDEMAAAHIRDAHNADCDVEVWIHE